MNILSSAGSHRPYCLLFCFAVSLQSADIASPEEQERANFGYKVLAISDLTNDGVPELAVSAFHNTDPRGPRGTLFVLNGKDYTLVSRCQAKSNDYGSFGWSLAEGWDVNGDGAPEVVVGAVYDDRPDLTDLGYGKAYLVDPKTGVVQLELSAPRPRRGTFFGISTALLRSKKPDQADLIAVGAPRNGGYVHLFDKSAKIVRSFQAPIPRPDWFGASLAAIDDVNGDEFSDLAVGAGSEDGERSTAGAAYIVSGLTGQLLSKLVPADVPSNTRFRWSVAAVPDVDGDGKSDVLAGLPFALGDDGSFGAGRVCLFSGADGRWLRTIGSPEPQERGWFGWSVAGVQDITGDGAGELIVGCSALGAQGIPTYGERRAYLFNGATGQLIQTFQSAMEGEGFGLSAVGMHDKHGKLRSVAVGAPHESPDPAPFRSGRLHIFHLSLSFLTAAPDSAGIRLSLTATDERNYDIESSPDLSNWTRIRTAKPSDRPITFLDVPGTGTPRRFYRAQSAD